MKKLLFVLLVVFGFVACGQHASIAQDTEVDTLAIDTVAKIYDKASHSEKGGLFVEGGVGRRGKKGMT